MLDFSNYNTPVHISTSSESRDFPVILQFVENDGMRIPQVQGADNESRRRIQQIETHSVFDPAIVSGETADEIRQETIKNVPQNELIYPFGIHQPIFKDAKSQS